MTVVNHTFPQSGDQDFAENFAAWLGRGNISDYVETGFGFTPDYVNNTLEVSDGKAYVIIDEKTISSNSETRLVLDYVVEKSTESDIAINGTSETNYVYLNPNTGSNDSASFNTETSTGAAGSDWLLIGVVDAVNETYELLNRDPSADFETLTARGTFDVPTYSEFDDATPSESSVIYIDGAGTPDTGLYVHDGSEYISAGVREITKLNDVTGIESIESNTSGNRPAAGTQGRFFIDESNNNIQIDNGGSWDILGTNPSNIGAADLGFNTATQNELDTHIGTNDAHHNRPTAGNGLKDQTSTFNIEPTDFAGTFLSDNSDNLEVQIGFGLENDGSGQIEVDEGVSFTFSSQQIINNTLTMGGDIDLSNNNLTEPNRLSTSGSGSDVITVYDSNNTVAIAEFYEGGEVAINSGDLTDGANVIYDQSASEIPDSAMGSIANSTLTNSSVTVAGNSVSLGNSTAVNHNDLSTISSDDHHTRYSDEEAQDAVGTILTNDFTYDDAGNSIDLANNSITLTGGDGLKNGSTASLGGSFSLDIEPNDFAGAGLEDDGADNIRISSSAVGDGLTGGSGSAINIEPANFAGTFLSDDGSDNLQVNISSGLEGDGAGNIKVNEDTDFTFTSTIDFSAGLDTQGNIKDGNQIVWDATNQEVPDSALGSVDNSTLSNSSVTVAGNSVSLGGSTAVNHNDLSTISSDDHHTRYSDEEAQDAVGTILTNYFNYDDAGNSIDLANNSITINANDGLKSGGTVSLGGSVGLDVEPADFAGVFLSDDGTDNLTVDIGRGLENDGSGNVRVDEEIDFTFTSTIDFSSGLDTQGDISDGSQTIWSTANQEIPDSAMGSIANSTLTNSSLTVTAGNGLKNGGSVSLGNSISINIEPTDFAGEHLADDGSDNLAVDIGDDSRVDYGAGDDMATRYDSTSDSYKVSDETNTTDRFEVERTTGNVNITGEITENTSL
jgi:chorismate synthase